jgi:hypothetical protein
MDDKIIPFTLVVDVGASMAVDLGTTKFEYSKIYMAK